MVPAHWQQLLTLGPLGPGKPTGPCGPWGPWKGEQRMTTTKCKWNIIRFTLTNLTFFYNILIKNSITVFTTNKYKVDHLELTSSWSAAFILKRQKVAIHFEFGFTSDAPDVLLVSQSLCTEQEWLIKQNAILTRSPGSPGGPSLPELPWGER